MDSLFSLHTQSFSIDVISMKEIEDIDLKILTNEEISTYNALVSTARKLEFINTRILLKQLFKDEYSPIQYETSGKPFLQNFKLGISHSKHEVAIIIAEEGIVGIDIEQYRETIFKISSRFINTFEAPYFTSIEDLTLVWSAKEVLFKMYNASPDFKEHYTITKILEQDNSGTLHGSIHTDLFEKQIELSYFRNSKFCIVWGYNEN